MPLTPDSRKVFKPPISINRRIKTAKKEYSFRKDLFSIPPSIVFISNYLPRYDKTSADYRIHNILNILLENGCNINYLYSANTRSDARYANSLKGNISFKQLPLDVKALQGCIADTNAGYVCITNLWRLHYSRVMADLVEVVRDSEKPPKLIVDTMDFHAKEFIRKHQLNGNDDDRELADAFLSIEKKLYRLADVVVTVSDKESRDIRDAISGIKKIQAIPNIQKSINTQRLFHKRKNICYVGHFGNSHNVDAAAHFIDNIFPLIREAIPHTEFHVIGTGSEKYRKRFNAANVKVIGRIRNLQKALSHYRLFVCPMIYGAGMKGKIGLAIESGLPVVTTSIGAEGFPVNDGKECFIADTPERFAQKSIQCMTEPLTWYELSSRSALMAAKHFGPGIVSIALQTLFSETG